MSAHDDLEPSLGWDVMIGVYILLKYRVMILHMSQKMSDACQREGIRRSGNKTEIKHR